MALERRRRLRQVPEVGRCQRPQWSNGILLPLNQFCLKQFQLEPDGAKLVTVEKLEILVGSSIGDRLEDCTDRLSFALERPIGIGV